jgi:glycopeptide antibiotics resistance protein
MGTASYQTISFALNAAALLLAGLVWLGVVAFLRVRKRKSFAHLLFVTVFYAYVVKVLDYTLFQFQSLLILKRFVPGLMLNGYAAGERLNLIPLLTLAPADLKTSLLNVLLLVPFGFGLPFVTSFRAARVVLAGALFSLAIELLQLSSAATAETAFRIADVNDVIFNTLGAALGYALFVGFVRAFRRVSRAWKVAAHPILRHVADRPQV